MSKQTNESKHFNPLYGTLDIEELNGIIPIYIKVCRNIGGRNTYREYQRQIIGKIVRYHCAETNDVCNFFGMQKASTLLDNLRECYEWIFNVNHNSRFEKIYVDISNGGYGIYEEFSDY